MTRFHLRSAALTGYATLARALGLDPPALLRAVGLPLRCLASPDLRVPARKCFRLLELSADQAACPDFGLRLVRERGLSHLGTLGLLARDQPDVRAALRRVIGGLNMHSTCVALSLDEREAVAVLRVSVFADGEKRVRQATDATVSGVVQMLASLLGGRWQPVEVHLLHDDDLGGGYAREFRCPVFVGAQVNAVVLRAAELDRPVVGADRGFQRVVAPLARSVVPLGGALTADTVRRVAAELLPDGRCTSLAVADRLGVHRRTLCRHLAQEGTEFTAIVDALRAPLALQYLQAGMLSMQEIAALLGFHSQGSFSRWFLARQGCSPTAWRQRQVVARSTGRSTARAIAKPAARR